MPPVTPPPLTSLPANPAPAVVPAPEKADVHMQYPNAQIADVLTAYESLTGKRILRDSTVQGQVDIVINKPVTKDQAISIIETALTLNGYSLVQGAGDIVKVLGLGINVRQKGVPIFSDLADVPQNEQEVSFFMRLRYLDAGEIAAQLQQYIPQANSVAFTPLPKSGALIITDVANSVRRIASLLLQLDVPSAPVVEKFIRLERADATKAVEFLNSVFETKSAGTASPTGVQPNAGQPNVRRPIRRLNEEGQPVADLAGLANVPAGLIPLSGDSIIQGRVTLTADIRTNRIHVVTQPVNLPLVENLIAEYDSDTPFAEPVRRPLKFVSARDVLPILVQALTEPGTDNPQNGANGTPGQTNRTPNSSSGNSNNLFNNNNSNGNSLNGSSGSSNIGQEQLNTPEVDTTPTEAVVGSTKIIADQRSNTIILLGGAEAKDKVFQILEQLDVRVPQVVIRAIIGELSLGNNNEFGLNYLLRRKGTAAFSQFNAALTGNSSTTTTGTTGTTGTTTGTTFSATNSSTLQTLTDLATGLPSGFTGLGGIVAVGKSLDVIVSALDATDRFKTISSPTILTTNNKKAIIASGTEIAVPTSSVSSLNGTSLDNTAVQSNIQYKDVTLQLEVSPLINSEDEVTLDIVQQIDSIVSGQSVQIGGNKVPTIATRKLKSNVSMPNGATVVLGGLITQSDSVSNNNVPYLSKIPILGNIFFRSHTDDKNRSELLILLQPEVINTPKLLAQRREQEEHRLYMEPDLDGQLNPVVKTTKTKTTTTTLRGKPVLPATAVGSPK